MSGILSYVPLANKVVGADGNAKSIQLPCVKVHNVETDPEPRARCLKHLLKANHVNYSVLYNGNRFDNHNPHILSSAYIMGASVPQLNDIYEEQVKELDPWIPAPAEIVDNDWGDFLGNRPYQRAYLDFFEDKLAMDHAYNWKSVVEHYLFANKAVLFHSLTCGLGHPLIQLGYAYEMDSKEIAMEALAMAATQHGYLHRYSQDAAYTRESPIASESPLKLLTRMAGDDRFDKLPTSLAYDDLEGVLKEHDDLFLEYWNGWRISDPKKAFEESQRAAVDLLVSTVQPDSHGYKFVIVHLLTSSHAVRVLLPFLPAHSHIALLRQWWFLVVAMFVLKGRPMPNSANVDKDLGGRNWKYVIGKAINGPWYNDSHFVKAVRAIRDIATTWGDEDEAYLKAAATFVDNFEGWSYS